MWEDCLDLNIEPALETSWDRYHLTFMVSFFTVDKWFSLYCGIDIDSVSADFIRNWIVEKKHLLNETEKEGPGRS